MRKVVIERPGGYEKLKIVEIADCAVGGRDLLIRVEAIGVNYADCVIRWGLYESAKRYVGYPITPGFEVSGTIEAMGEGVAGPWQIGDKVLGVTRFGGYSSLISLPEDQVYPIPQQLSLQQAAGFPAVFLTAYHALFQNVIRRPGMKVLIHSAAGGVGGALVQLAKVAQMDVVGVVGSSHKVESVLKLGANYVVDKSRYSSRKGETELWREIRSYAPEGYDMVLDANGFSTLKQSYDHLRPTGKLICYGFHSMLPKQGGRVSYISLIIGYLRIPRFNPLNMTSQNKSLITFNLSFLFDRKDLFREGMEALIMLLKEGKIAGHDITTFPLERVGEAHAYLESGKSVGKIILLPN